MNFTRFMTVLLFAIIAVCGGENNVVYAVAVTPVVVSVSPVDTATGVATNAEIDASFSEAMKPSTINRSTFTLKQGTTPVPGTVSYAHATAIFKPTSNFAFNTTYTATITVGAQDLAGNPLASNFTWSFTTVNATPPTVISEIPVNTATGVATNAEIVATFSEAMRPLTLNRSTFTLKNMTTSVSVPGTVSYAHATAIFKPTSKLALGTKYTATITTGAKNLAGSALASNFKWSFTTVPGDTTPPTVVSEIPANAATGVETNAEIDATFSEAMKPSTINRNTFILKHGTTPVPGTVSYSHATAIFVPSSSLAPNTLYTATITTGVQDLAGNAMASSVSWSFTTVPGDTTPPTVISVIPVDTATGVATNAEIVATFSKAMIPSTINGSTFTLTHGTTPVTDVTGTVSYANATAIFKPSNPLAPNTLYTATINIGAQDLAGIGLTSNYTWSFTTAATIPPTVTSTVPVNFTTDVAANAEIVATFSEAMSPVTINKANFTLMNGANPVAGTVTYDTVHNAATFVPSSNLAPSTTYTAMISVGAKDMAGDALAANFVWSFTTGPNSDTPPTVSSTVPANATTGVATNTEIIATFDKAMKSSTINGSTVTLKNTATSVSVAATVTYDAINHIAACVPFGNLSTTTEYTATITTGVQDLAGNAMAANFVWSFTTGATPDNTAPTVSSVIPVHTATGVATNTEIVASFSEAMIPSSLNGSTFTLKDTATSVSVSGTVSYIGTTAMFRPLIDLAPDTEYTATITTGAQDMSGNALAAPFVWSFTTGTGPDTTPPTVTLTNPADSAVNVALSQTVSATFSEPMDPLTINTANFTLTDGATPVVGTVTYDVKDNIATFVPLSNLTASTMYTATITTGVKNLAGIALSPSDKIWSFTTGTSVTGTGQAPIDLGVASTFAILATDSTSETTTGDRINGDVGLNPGTSQGITPSEINGNIYVHDTIAAAAQVALLAAYNDAASRSTNAQSLPGDLSGLTLYPGLYVNASSTGITTGTLYLDAQGDPNAVFIFQTPALTTGTSTSIVLSGGAQAKNVYWQIASSATLGVTSIFKGTILADISVTVDNGAVVEGRLFAGSGPGGAGAAVVSASILTVPAR